MPRQAPTQVIEHRISLQDAERKAVLEPVGKILTDIEQFTKSANTVRQVAVYGGLGVAAAGLYYIPKVWQETTVAVAGALNALNPLSAPERFIDWWEDRGIPTGIFGDLIKNRL